MIAPFVFARNPAIQFGSGKISVLPKAVKAYGKHVLIITGAASFINSKTWAKLQDDFSNNGITWDHFTIDKEPSPSLVDECVKNFQEKNIEVVVAIGGGSVLDAGKAISAMLREKASVQLFLEGVGTRTHSGNKVPFIAVPTTSGTGSEATKNAVLSEVGEQGFKKSLRHDNFVPDLAIVDPDLTLSCPKHITAYTGMDAFTQLLESFLSTNANPMTDSLALEGLKRISASLVNCYENGKTDIGARTDMAYASLISGITLANAGLGTVHGFASTIGGYFDIPHGVICSALMGPVNNITVKSLQQKDPDNIALQKYAEVGKLFSKDKNKSDAYYIEFILTQIDELTKRLEIPKLSAFNLTGKDIDRIVTGSDNKNNPVKLSPEQMAKALEMAL
ncbi:MAG: iron-containing alcohol dehydrogenase [Sporocytophaga sp.]|uniref:iron-containing alcohol dehydrogenase n=1 Tax=Sporocytophaga sp. TaxID=2231183 RepID=UPI001B21102F|nr:iron-containing alcohol dehydrogenase [Sporocytophaga sp.]MBO9700358.1 iron-containing alcohol dehydrogenase [Sporocytophaga sp.]